MGHMGFFAFVRGEFKKKKIFGILNYLLLLLFYSTSDDKNYLIQNNFF